MKRATGCAAALVGWAVLACATRTLDAQPRYPTSLVAPKFRALAAQRPACIRAGQAPKLPPEPDQATTRAEIEVLLALQATRTAGDLAAIRTEAGDILPLFLARAALDRRRAPRTIAWLRRAAADLDALLFAEKFRVLRPRPHQLDARLRPAIAVPRHPAYPSGHGGQARLIARLLAAVAPARGADLLAYAASVGWRREQAGVHFGSDTAAGATLGDAVAKVYLSDDPCARRWREPARPEWPTPAAMRGQRRSEGATFSVQALD